MLVRHVLYQLSYAPLSAPRTCDGLIIIQDNPALVNRKFEIFCKFFLGPAGGPKWLHSARPYADKMN